MLDPLRERGQEGEGGLRKVCFVLFYVMLLLKKKRRPLNFKSASQTIRTDIKKTLNDTHCKCLLLNWERVWFCCRFTVRRGTGVLIVRYKQASGGQSLWWEERGRVSGLKQNYWGVAIAQSPPSFHPWLLQNVSAFPKVSTQGPQFLKFLFVDR